MAQTRKGPALTGKNSQTSLGQPGAEGGRGPRRRRRRPPCQRRRGRRRWPPPPTPAGPPAPGRQWRRREGPWASWLSGAARPPRRSPASSSTSFRSKPEPSPRLLSDPLRGEFYRRSGETQMWDWRFTSAVRWRHGCQLVPEESFRNHANLVFFVMRFLQKTKPFGIKSRAQIYSSPEAFYSNHKLHLSFAGRCLLVLADAARPETRWKCDESPAKWPGLTGGCWSPAAAAAPSLPSP